MKKKGFELSISVIVTIIIGVVLLALGIYFLYDSIGKAQNLSTELDAETEQQLALLLESGERVAVPFNTATIRRGDSKVLGVGILNIYEEQNFKIEVAISSAFDKEENLIPVSDAGAWTRYDFNEFPLGKNDQYKGIVLFEVPKNVTSGTYIFDIRAIQVGTGLYGLKKVYITVP